MNDGRTRARVRDATILAFQRSYGMRVPDYVFPARITGIARLANPVDKSGTVVNSPEADPPCSDPIDYPTDDCTTVLTPDADGFFPPDVLPCGVFPVRYRWQALHDPALNSESCGIRLKSDGTWTAWRQAFYAINEAEYFYPGGADLPFPFIRPGTNVHLAFGPIGRMTSQADEWGFFFNVTADPQGATECPSSVLGGDVTGCCQVKIVATNQVINEFCEQPQFCVDPVGDPSVIYTYLGDGIDCQVFPNDCTSATDLETICCTLINESDGSEIASFCETRQNCQDQVAPGFIDVLIDERDPCGFESCNFGGTGGTRRPGNPIHDSNGRLVVTYDGRLGTCQE